MSKLPRGRGRFGRKREKSLLLAFGRRDRNFTPFTLSPPQRPLCIVGRLLCCGEAGEKDKESARGTLSIFSIIDIFMGIPSRSLCGGESLLPFINYETPLVMKNMPDAFRGGPFNF